MSIQSVASFQLLGDVVGSRRADDRAALHRAVAAALTSVDRVVPGLDALGVTVGDEFQGRYPTLGEALDAALRIRLILLPEADVRIGVGRGSVISLEQGTRLQDGPGWWAAREAIEGLENHARWSGLSSLRTAYRSPEQPEAEAGVNAALACRDQLIGSMPERPVRILRRLLDGDTQAAIAAAEEVSASAISQQVRSHGIGVILHAHELLRRMP